MTSTLHDNLLWRWRRCLAVACLLLVAGCAQAGLRVHADSLTLPGASLQQVDVHFAVGSDGRPQLRLVAAKVSIPALGWHGVGLTLAGTPQRAVDGTWKFAGHAATRNAPGGALSDAAVTLVYDATDGTLEVGVTQGSSKLDALMPLDQTSHMQLNLASVPLRWLQGVLASLWPPGRLQGGAVTGSVALDLAAGASRGSGRVALANVNLDTKTGTIATQKFSAAGTFRMTGGATSRFMFDGTLRGGQVLLGPLYVDLPTQPAYLHVALAAGPKGIAVDSLDYDDHDALRVAGSFGFDREGRLSNLDLRRFAATFPAAYTRYGTALIQRLTGLTGVTASGGVVGSLSLRSGHLQALDLAAEDVSLHDSAGALAVSGLDGRIDWRARASRPATTLAWNELSLYRLALGPAKLALRDDAGVLALTAPLAVGLFGGTLQVNRLAWRPDANAGQQLSAGLAVSGVNLSSLSAAFGWPAFGGTLGGAVPDVTYRDGALTFGGGLSLGVFGGSVSVTDLRLEHPLGTNPLLAADIALQKLDLAKVTGAFDFGQISGLLDGRVQGLRLVDWKPVAFVATLHTEGGGRISQDALKSLTEVGGGGIAGGLQSMALRLFKTFGYARIGLSCTLAGGVCTMGGIQPEPDPGNDGYTIVEGSGLPHITVVGHERAVDWATLLNRLQAATHGSKPVVR